jgi:drug/metabolite transporter (DMT)-like permease
MLVGGVALSFVHPPWHVEGTWDARAWLFLAFILVLGTLVAFYLFNMALTLIGAQKTILLTCGEPLSAAVLSVWWLGVSWGAMDWLGTACILLTIVLLAKEQSPEAQAEKVT